MKIKTIVATGVTGLCLSMPLAFAKVSEQEAAKLGTELTPMGAQKEGNAEGNGAEK